MEWDVVVVGGGMAGLTAAAYSARAGKSVLLIEKNEKVGGLVNSFERDGFVFDGGVRALENAGIILPMLEDLGIKLDFVNSPVSVGIEDRIIHVTSRESLEDYRELLLGFYPESREDVERVIKAIKKIMAEMEVLYGVDNPLFLNLRRDLLKFLRYGPWFFRFLKTLYAIRKMSMPVEEFLDGLIKNRSLRDIISQHFFRGTPAFFAMSYFYLYTNYIYPKGGVGKLAEKVEEKARELGAEITTNTAVTRVVPSERVVYDSEGRAYRYKKLIWAADLKTLYRGVDPKGLPEGVRRKFEEDKKRILSGKGADSVFTLFMAVDEKPETFAEVSKGHFFYTPSRQGLGEVHRGELESMLASWENVTKENLMEWVKRFCSLNTYEISIPALRDPKLAPPGKTGLIVSFLFDYRLARKVKEAGWYEEFNREMARQMIKTLSESVYPELEDKVIFSFTATPLTIEQFVGSSYGSIVGWSFEEPLPIEKSMLFPKRAVLTPLPDIFKAGQWAYSPAGVPTAILTGRLAVKAALGV